MSKGLGKYYKISDDGETLKRLKRSCPRCGPGFFMAEMYDRIVCGHCGFTEFKKKPAKKAIEEEEEEEQGKVEIEGAEVSKEVKKPVSAKGVKKQAPAKPAKEELKPKKKKKK